MITAIIATTLLDANKEKFTLNLLKKFRDEINTIHPQIRVTNEGKDIGIVQSATISKKKLKITLDIRIKDIDKTWEYFFVPYFEGGKYATNEGMTVITSALIKGVHMVKFPTDVSLKPTVFPFVEGEDYFVVKFDEIELSDEESYSLGNKPVLVYYPLKNGNDFIQKDALERGFLVKEKGEFINKPPFYVQAVEENFESVRQWAANQFKIK